MPVADHLPELVADFVGHSDAPTVPQLLNEVQRHVGRVCRNYPPAWFTLGNKDADSVADLGNRVFTTCATVTKGRFPFSGRPPFVAFVAEQFDGRAIRYHSFYAKLSITREIMRNDYAHNLVRDPVLRWRAELYKNIGRVLKGVAISEPQGPGLPPRWRLIDTAPGPVRSEDAIIERLRSERILEVHPAVVRALQVGGPRSQSRLTHVIEALLGTPAAPELDSPVTQPPDHETTMSVRRAVTQAWQDLDPDDRDLLLAIARGDSYDELVAANPRFKHKVAVTRAVTRVGKGFVDRVVEAVAGELPEGAAARPKDLVEHVLAVLLEVTPELLADAGGEVAP